jgi:hypothetical protein
MNITESAASQEVNDPSEVVLCTVVAFAPELLQARVLTGDGHRYAITRHTPGVEVLKLHVGQKIECTVTRRLPRVLSACAVD